MIRARMNMTIIMMMATLVLMSVGCANKSTSATRVTNYKIASPPSSLDGYSPDNARVSYRSVSRGNTQQLQGGYQFANLENNVYSSRPVNDPSTYGSILHEKPTNDIVSKEYHVGAGDVLMLKIDQLVDPDKEAVIKVEVDRNGMIYLPVLNHVSVAGMTVDDIQKTLLTTLASHYMKNPKVDVTVDSYESKKVLVLGEVRSPGAVTLRYDAVSILEVINEAGGLTSNVSPYVEIMRGAYKNFADIAFMPGAEYRNYRGTQYQRELIPLGRVMGEGNLDQINPLVRSGDVIRILPVSEGFVYFSGEFRLRGSQVFRRPLTLLQALALAGGPTEIAKAKECRIIRRNTDGTEREIQVNVDKVLKGEGENIMLACNDTLIMPVDPWKKFWQGFFGLFTGGVRVGVDTTYDAAEKWGWPGSYRYRDEN